jgi:hypothetical protein
LLLLKHIYGLSDEGVCERWVHDPYFQHFTGEEFFQHEFPHERSDLSHWRKRLGDKLERLLAESLRVAHESGALRTRDLKRVTVDTTVQPTRLFLHELLAVVQMPEHLGAVRCIQALQAQILPFEFVQKILLRDLAGLSALLCRWCPIGSTHTCGTMLKEKKSAEDDDPNADNDQSNLIGVHCALRSLPAKAGCKAPAGAACRSHL